MNIFPFAVFKVEGESMLPDFRPGDFIILNRWACAFRKPRAQEVIVLRDPRRRSRLLLKRITAVLEKEVYVQGAHLKASVDSRTFGYVLKKDILGRPLVIFHR
jgi:nickel-type superoxide dismutase maturation protease